MRNGVAGLGEVIGRDAGRAQASRAARLTGLQNYAAMAEAVGGIDGGPDAAADFLVAMFAGMGDDCIRSRDEDGTQRIVQSGLRIVRGLDGALREDMLESWTELWRGAVQAHRAFIQVECDRSEETLTWRLRSGSV